jgi:hypothetical protein
MKIVTRIFTTANELRTIKKDLDIFLNIYCKNPFNLYPFIENFLQSFCQDSTLIILVSRINEKIVGLAPLQLEKTLVFHGAVFILPYEHSPDFIVIEEYREEVLRNFLHIIVTKIKCKRIVLDLPDESKNLPILERICIDYKLKFRKQFTDTMSHCTISVQGSLAEFERSRGSESKRKFKRISRNLDKMGKWKIILIDDWNNDQVAQDAFDKMMTIEKKSWKENLRSQTGNAIDEDLLWLWNSSLSTAKTNPDFKFKLWFLELNDQAIAYDSVIEYRGTAFFAKTSYAEKYRRLYPGIFICNVLISDQFRRQEVKTIDFLTNLPYMRRWNVICSPRVRFILSEGAMSDLFESKLITLLSKSWDAIKCGKINILAYFRAHQ